MLSESKPHRLAIPRPLDRMAPRYGAERRRPVRLLGFDVPGVFDHRIPLRIVDLSELGLGVESGRPLPFLEGAKLRVDPCERPLSVRVAWSKLVRVGHPSGPLYRTGVELLEPTFEQIRALLEAADRCGWQARKQPRPLPV